jgi:predicted DsbA family dithiol-disulfide isomerase
VLHAFCPLCTASAITLAAMVAAAFRSRAAIVSGPAGASPAGALTLAIFAALPLLIFTTANLVESKTPGGLWLVDLAAAHRLGPANAPVQIVVYSDFQCPFCRQLAPVLERLHDRFPKETMIVYRHYPLDAHPRAFPAAVASECAAEQGKFWEYHDKLFADDGDLGDAALLETAKSLGLDAERFRKCLGTEPPRKAVEANLREAHALGLPGAPIVFLNGRRFEGQPTSGNLAKRVEELLHSPRR